MSGKAVQLAYVGYLMAMGAATMFVMLWMSSPGFRYWLWTQSRQLQYRWAVWEYQMSHEPIPEWVKQMNTEPELPQEP
jgi:hypothetical protein